MSESRRVASGPMSAMSESSDMKLPARLDIRPALLPLEDRDHLAELDLEAVGVDAHRLHACFQARNLPLVVGTEDVDDPVETAHEEFVAVVGEVSAEVGDVAVGLHEHPVPRVAELARPEPGGPVLLVDEAARPEQVDRLGHGA